MKRVFIRFLPFIFITGLILLVFAKVIHFDYVLFDDDNLILKPFLFIKDLRNIPAAFLQDANVTSGQYSNYYRPLVVISFIFDAHFCGKEIYCYHITTLLLHILFCFVLYIFLIKVKVKRWIALLLTLIFSVHPALVANIAWVPGR